MAYLLTQEKYVPDSWADEEKTRKARALLYERQKFDS